MKLVKVKNFLIGKGQPLAVICGPCVIESEEHALAAAEYLKELFVGMNLNFVYKSSYDKANRSSFHSFRGPGVEKGLKILEKIKKELEIIILIYKLSHLGRDRSPPVYKHRIGITHHNLASYGGAVIWQYPIHLIFFSIVC